MKHRRSVRVLMGTSVAFLLAGLTAYARTSGTYELTQSVSLAGAEVPPGVYKVRCREQTPKVTVSLWAGRRKVAAATGKWLERNTTYGSDAFICRTGESGSRAVVEMRFAGKSRALVLDEAEVQSTSTSLVVTLCSVAKLGEETRSAPGGGCPRIRFLGTPKVPRRDVLATDPHSANSFPGWNQRVIPQRK